VASIATLALVGLTVPAANAETLGQTSGAADGCGSAINSVQDGSPGYVASSDGVVVSWSYLAHAGTPDLRLRIYFGSGTSWTARSESAVKPGGTGAGKVNANTTSTFPESPGLPIHTGDHLGLTTSGDTSNSWACIPTSSAADLIRQKDPPQPPVGTAATFPGAALTNLKIGVSAVTEPDADGDHYGDTTQDSCTTDSTVHTGPCPVGDQDGDGVPNTGDNCFNVPNHDQANADGDSQGDACDTDDDNDGVADTSDNCRVTANTDQANSDGDAQGDACDADDDNDGVLDTADNCRVTQNADQANTDGANDGGNACDSDDDNDGVPDGTDNCSLVANPTQANADGDAQGDACDPDHGPTAGNDTLTGDALGNTICGLLGNDIINGLGGNDTLFGDACNDILKPVSAAAVGADGNDTLNGGTGDDKLFGAGGNDTLNGGPGNDTLNGGGGNDNLNGGGGNDKLTDRKGVNKLKGGAGNDTLNARNGKKETVDCGSGKKDKATVDKKDVVKGCESVSRAKK
jgi:hypothetical protein